MKEDHTLKVKNIGIDTYRENIVFMRFDCHVCRAEGFSVLTRVMVKYRKKQIVATLNVVHSGLIGPGEVGLSNEALRRLGVKDGDVVRISHLQPIPSVKYVRAKIYGHELSEKELLTIIKDITAGYYSNIELSAFITACSDDHLSLKEIRFLTKAMISSGKRITWSQKAIYDKHCVGGLPGNRTTPIVVSILAARGLMIPKTSSRAITSPAGTADTMEVMTNVNLSMETLKAVVQKEKGCFAWGGSVNLSPADDILISVEKALDVDSEGQMIASVLSKKVAAGSTHVLIDIPVGKTAKVRTQRDAERLKKLFQEVGESIGLKLKVLITDGSQPVGRGVGPALEAMDVLSVLRNEKSAPQDLKERALNVAAELLEFSGEVKEGKGYQEVKKTLESGKAYSRFLAICKAQGRFTEPTYAPYEKAIKAQSSGVVVEIDNRGLAKIGKLAGAPKSPRAGIVFLSPLHKKVKKGETLFTIYSETKGELDYAIEYLKSQKNTIIIK